MSTFAFSVTAPYVPAKNFAEIGAAMGISRQRAEQIYQRAMKKLRKAHGENVEVLLKELDGVGRTYAQAAGPARSGHTAMRFERPTHGGWQ